MAWIYGEEISLKMRSYASEAKLAKVYFSLFSLLSLLLLSSGVGNFCTDIEFMMGQYPGWYWRLCWYLVTPGLLLIILIYSLIELKNPTVGTYEFQAGALGEQHLPHHFIEIPVLYHQTD
jgi:hypothetical protein